MASIKFLIRTSKQTAQIYARVKVSQSKDWKKKTGLYIDSNNWNKTKGVPKQNNETSKKISSQLRKLKDYLIDEINDSNNVTSEFVSFKIDVFFGRRKNDKIVLFNDFCEKFVEDLNEKRGSESVTISSVKKYTTIYRKVLKFDPKGIYKVEDVGLQYKKDFVKFLATQEKLSDNTVGRYVKFLKTFLLEAERQGFELHNTAKQINGFTVKSEKITLSFDEIYKIIDTKIELKRIEAARDWLIISCYTGQRVSDLLRMNTGMINKVKGFEFIELTQKKTGKTIQIPIHSMVRKILDSNNGFPPLFNDTGNMDSNAVEYNENLKYVCKLSGLDKMTLGSLYCNETKTHVKKEYPKWKLISSHAGRRSFATNFYGKYPTPLLMSCTGHSTEKMFLEYVGKPSLDSGLELARLWNE